MPAKKPAMTPAQMREAHRQLAIINASTQELLDALTMKANDWNMQGIEAATAAYQRGDCNNVEMLGDIAACCDDRKKALDAINHLALLLTTS